ncbi:MAG: CdaR family protein, partial [Chloroflexota bacterium]|nr:CdaR family protein [Chloroflexota bacterium]
MDEQHRQSIGSNWIGRLLLSLILAIALWAWVTTTRDPETSRVFANIAPGVSQLHEGLVIVGDINPVGVTVTGPRSVINGLLSTEVTAELDLESITSPGTYNVRIETPRPDDVWSASATPRSVNLIIEAQAAVAFPLIPVQTGNVGSNQQVESIRPSASEVVVTGPESLVSRVVSVELPVNIENRTTDFAGVFTPVAVDETGQEIAGLTLNPASVPATVEITARGKRVAVIAQINGDPSSGFEVVDRLVNPGTVLVDGPADVLVNLITVSTEVVDISGAQGDVTERVDIAALPPGVTLIDPRSGQVDVVVQIRQRGVQQPLPSQQVRVVNLGAGLEATIEPDSVLLTIIGNEQEIEALSTSDLIVQVDATGLGEGTYQLRPTVILPPNME